MPMEKPTFFTKVLQTLRKLSTAKGFTLGQILKHFSVKRDQKEVKSIVEKSLRYGVQNKLLLQKSGKYHITVARLRSLHVNSSPKDKKKKHVRFKKSKININDALIKTKQQNIKTKNNQKFKESKKSRTSTSKRSKQFKEDPRGNKRNEQKNTETSSQSKEATELENQQKSDEELLVEKKESKESLNVTPEKDVHDNCVNKKRNCDQKPIAIPDPPGLESDPEIGWEPPRPATKLNRKTSSRHSSKVRKDLQHKYKHYYPHVMEHKKRLKDIIPDDKMYRKHKTHSRHNYDLEYSEIRSYNDFNFKEKRYKKCCHHNCNKHHHKRRHTSADFLLERKTSNTFLDHLNRNETVLETPTERLTPFEVFLETNHSKLETIAENISGEDSAEKVEDEAIVTFDTSYIN